MHLLEKRTLRTSICPPFGNNNLQHPGGRLFVLFKNFESFENAELDTSCLACAPNISNLERLPKKLSPYFLYIEKILKN